MRICWVCVSLFVLMSMLVACGPAATPTPSYPTKSITYLIAFDPGGQSDREAKAQVPFLERGLGQKILIEYRVGGGGAVGWAELAKAKPDGYTIAGINVPHIILQPLQQDVGYKTEQLVPVVLLNRTPVGLAVAKNSPYQTLKDYLAAAKAKPGEFAVGGSGTFTGHHIAALRVQKLAGVSFKYVSFTGAAPQMQAFMNGQVPAVFASSDDLVKNKDQIKILAMATAERFSPLPNVPTFKESGIDMVEAVERGVGVPNGTPDAVIKRLETAFLDFAKNPETQADMQKQGFIPLAMGAKESKEYIEKLIPVYKELLKDIK